MKTNRIHGLFAAAFLTCLSGAVLADEPPRGPPPEAFSACQSKAQGDACTVTMGDHTMTGTCGSRDGGTLACHPAHGPGGHHGPPPEAFTACASKATGDACTVTHGDHSMTGSCKSGPDSKEFCAPAGPPPGPPPGQ